MKLGYVHAITALLLGGGALLAQAPLPVEHETPAKASDTPPAPRSFGLAPVQYSQPAPVAAPVAAPLTAPVAIPDLHPEGNHHDCDAGHHAYLDTNSGFNGCLVYGSADYLLWHISQTNVPSIVNTIPVGVLTVTTSDSNVDASGNTTATGLNQVVHFFPVSISDNSRSPGTIDPGNFSGARLTLGAWLDSDHCFGIEGSAFGLQRLGTSFATVSNNANNQFTINTPFTSNVFQVTPVAGGGTTRTLFESFPVFFVRQANLDLEGNTHTQMWGAEVNARSTWCCYGPISVGYLAGVRYQNFQDGLEISNNFTLFRPSGLPSQGGTGGDPDTGGGSGLGNPLTFATHDEINTYNHFVGGQIGLDLDALLGRFIIHARGQVAMGTTIQIVDVSSQTSNNDPKAGGVTAGGLLSGPNDQGTHTRSRLSFLPEFNLKVGYALTRNLQVYAGYDVEYLTHVARAANLTGVTTSTVQAQVVNTNVNLNVNSPVFRFSDGNVFASGFNFGVELAF